MLDRVLEPEWMDTPEDALAYDAMDHEEVNCLFVGDLLRAAGTDLSFQADDSPVEVLDIGTGTALQPIELCRQCEGVRVMATDAAEHMLDIARNNIEIASLTDRIMLDLVDAKRLPYDDGRFPIVMGNSIIHHAPEPVCVLREVIRVAAVGGLVFLRDLMRPETDAALKELVTTYAGDATEHQRRLFADSLRAALSLDEIREFVGQLGFSSNSAEATTDRHWTWSVRIPQSPS